MGPSGDERPVFVNSRLLLVRVIDPGRTSWIKRAIVLKQTHVDKLVSEGKRGNNSEGTRQIDPVPLEEREPQTGVIK